MTKAAELCLSNGIVHLGLLAEDAAGLALQDQLAGFLAPYFVRAEGQALDCRLRLAHRDAFAPAWSAAATQPMAFRRSSCPAYNLSGHRGELADGCILAEDEASGAAYKVDPATRDVTFYATPGNPGSRVHLLDFARYLALLIAESRGWVLLHASAVVLDGRVVLVLGDKGAGKTTTMLGLVAEQGAGYFSGDKVLAAVTAAGLELHAWPDIPYIGTGTLRARPGLAAALGVPLRDGSGRDLPAGEKHLVDPARFRSVVSQAAQTASGMPAAILLPDVQAAGPPAARWLPAVERRPETLGGIIEWPHQFLTAQWHGLFLEEARRGVPDRGQAVLEALARVPWLELKGRVGIPPLGRLAA